VTQSKSVNKVNLMSFIATLYSAICMYQKIDYLAVLPIIKKNKVEQKYPKTTLIVLFMLLPYCCMAISAGSIQAYAKIISILNIALLVTSAISIKQYLFPGDDNRMPFHVFNLIFGVLFYCISLPYLIMNKEYYEGYQQLIPLDIVGKFFFSLTLSAARQWVILVSLIINVLYIKKYNKDYYEAGIGRTSEEEEEENAPEMSTNKNELEMNITISDEQAEKI